nr:C. briggsae CBR-PQN-13 protein [Haemonchus contortus]
MSAARPHLLLLLVLGLSSVHTLASGDNSTNEEDASKEPSTITLSRAKRQCCYQAQTSCCPQQAQQCNCVALQLQVQQCDCANMLQPQCGCQMPPNPSCNCVQLQQQYSSCGCGPLTYQVSCSQCQQPQQMCAPSCMPSCQPGCMQQPQPQLILVQQQPQQHNNRSASKHAYQVVRILVAETHSVHKPARAVANSPVAHNKSSFFKLSQFVDRPVRPLL